MTNIDLQGSQEAKSEMAKGTGNDSQPTDDESKEQISPAEKSLLQKIIRKGLVETTKPLDVQRKNPNSPLYSIKSFEALHLLVIFKLLIFIYTSQKMLLSIH